jgi:hypothetical protein
MYLATLSAPEPRNGIEGLMHFIRITFAKIGVIIHEFHTPNYQQLESFRLVHLKFNFLLETDDHKWDDHRRAFRLTIDELDSRTSLSSGFLARLQEYAAEETAYLAQDKETRGRLSAKPTELIHTRASARGTEKFWKVKLVRPTVTRTIAPMFR